MISSPELVRFDEGQDVLAPSNLPASEVLAIYIASAGIINLALERINAKFYPTIPLDQRPFTHADLQLLLSRADILPQLQDQARAFTTMRVFETVNIALANLQNKLPQLSPFEASKTATNLVDKLALLTDRRVPETNVNNFVWEQLLPQEAVDAINFLKQQASPEAARVIEHEVDSQH